MTAATTLKTDNKIDEPHILSIIPAPPGWFAMWRDGAGEVAQPVACWALIEWKWGADRCRDVVAMTPGNGAGLELAQEAAFAELRFVPSGGAPNAE